MAKINLNDIQSIYDLTQLNQDFADIESEFQNKVLYRDNPVGEPNQMENDLDMNSNSILNAKTDLNDSGSLLTLGDADARYLNASGDTLESNINANGYKITNLGIPSAPSDAARLADVGPDSAATLRTELASSAVGEGSDLVQHTGTPDTVTEALDKRTIFVGSLTELPVTATTGQQAVVSGSVFKYDGASWNATGSVTPEAYGMKHSDTAFDNFPALKVALESGNMIEFPEDKTYTCLTTGEITASNISVKGNGSTLAFAPALPKGLHIKGEVLSTTTLSADAGLNENSIVVTSATNISEDTFLIVRNTVAGSFSAYRTAYTEGDLVRVREVSGTTVILEAPINKAIPAATSEVVVVSPVKFKGDDLIVTKAGSGAGQCAWFEYLWDSELKSIRADHGAVSIRLKHVLDSELYGCRGFNTVTATDPDGYGLSALNCKNVNEYDGIYVTVNNHAVDTSSGVDHNTQSTDVVFHNSVLLGGAWAASNHGGSERCGFVGCTADGAILGGLNPFFKDGSVLLNVSRFSASGISSIQAVRLTEMKTASVDVSGNTVIISNDNKDPGSTISFVQTIGSNHIGADTEFGGIINVTNNTFKYVGNRDAAVDGDFIGFQLGAASTATPAVQESTDIVFKNNVLDFGQATFVTAYQLYRFNDANVQSLNLISAESDIRRRLISNSSGSVSTDETMQNNLTQDVGVAQTLTNGVETTLFETAGTESAFEVVSGTVTGRAVQIRCYSDGTLVYDGAQADPRGQTSDGATVSVYSVPRITGAKSVKVTAEAYGADRVCGWSIVHKT